METDKLCRFVLGLLFLFLTLGLSNSAFAQSSDINFNLSANHYYNPGDKVIINISSYDYSNKSTRRNTFKVQILKIKNLEEFYSKQVSRGSIDILGADSTNLSFLTEEVRSFEKTIKAKSEYGYSYMNDGIEIGGLEKGAYIARITNKNKVAYIGFVISSLGVLSKAGTGSMLAYIVQKQSGEPVNNVSVNFYLGMNKIGSGVTNFGTAYQTFDINQISNLNNDINNQVAPLIVGQQGDDVIISDSYLYFGYGESKYSVYIYTNQPVYRTDSQVDFKGIIRTMSNFQYAIVPNQDITVKIKDSRNAEVYKEVLRSDNMGSVWGNYKIEKEAPLGTYTIYFELGENNTYSQTFSVEQYKKPEYKVVVTPENAQYLNNETIEAKVKADYYFGSPVTNAEVEYNIFKQRYYKPWWSYSEYAWWYADYYESQDENAMYNSSEMIYSGTGTLNENGEMTILYNIKEDFKNENNGRNWWWYGWSDETDYRYIIQAKVVDKSRREIDGIGTVLVTRGKFFITANANKYLYKPNDDVTITVRTMDFSDKPVSTDFSVNIYKYDFSYYKDNEYKKDFVATVNGKTLNEGEGTVTYRLPYNAEGYYVAEIEATDDRGNKITGSANFSVYKEGYSWYNENGGTIIMTDKDSYKIGDTVKAVVITPTPDANVLITAESDNILYYATEKFYGTSKEVLIPVTEKFSSNFYVKASYIQNGTMYDVQKMLMVVQEQKFLTVEIDPSKLIYKPKEKGELKVRVLDYMGLPVRNAEVSLGIIDESIYAIKEESTTDIRKFFYGPKWVYVSSSFESANYTYAYSRLLTIYERFNIASLKESELATVTGRLLDKESNIVPDAIIIIDDEYQAAITNDSGEFEFKLPAGKYSISIYTGKEKNEDVRELVLSRGETKNFVLYTDETLNDIAEQRGLVDGVQNQRLTTEEFSLDVMTSKTGVVQNEKNAPKSKKESGKDDYKTAEVRSDFRDAILWSPSQMTDDNGYTTVEVQYPDNLTEWRITSRVITEDTKVGQNVKTVITRKDLLVRMETPRFLQQNDNVTISTIVHNYLSSEKRAKVKFTADNVQPLNATEQTITIPSNGEVRLDWNINVTGVTGDAKLYVEALTDEESDAVELKVPLEPTGLKITNSVIADFDDAYKNETKNFEIPLTSNLQSASLKFVVSPSLASTILTALDELAGYPYGCVEQTMSRFLPTVVVARAFKELDAPISAATQKDLPKMVEAGLNRLYGFQHSDGGWGWWTNDGTNPFMTAYVVYGMTTAQSAGYTIKNGVLSNGVKAMKSQLKDQVLEPTTRAYVLYSLSLADKNSNTLIREYIKQLQKEDLNDYAKSLIILTLNEIGDTQKANEVVADLIKDVKYSGEGAAYWEGKSFHYNWQDDKVQTTAMALSALVKTNLHADLKNKIVRWLMMQRMGFAWRNTQETAFIVYSMVDYLKTSDELNPDYTIKVFVNEKEYMSKQLTRDDVFKKDEIIEVDYTALQMNNNVVRIEKTGTGKVYFSGTVNYYVNSSNVSAMENGFRVEREYYVLRQYESYKGENIVYRKYNYDGNIKSGDMLLVKLRVYAKDQNLSYFMLEDPLPAGCEVITDDWAYQIEDEKDYRTVYGYPYWRWWYADKDIRDDKVTFFATYLWGDHYEFSYIMRAQIPGEYNINPSVGALMYYPEVNGNSPTMRMNISDK
jgi:uncharacterized protein YfaS (alpha-2-macroglobulin family)